MSEKDELDALQAEVHELHGKIASYICDQYDAPLQHVNPNWEDVVEGGKKMAMKSRRDLRGHFGKIYAMHWCQSKDHKKELVSASQDGKLILWNGDSTNKLHTIHLRSSWVMTCAYSHSGTMVASGGLDNTCSIFSVHRDDGKMAGSWNPVNELSEHDGYLSCCRFVPGSVDSQLLTSSGDASCILWDVEYNTPMQIFDDHSTDVMCLDVTERTFVSGSCDGTAKLWDLRQLESVMTFVGHESDVNSVRFFPDGFSFGTGSDDSTCRLFDSRSYGQVNVYVNDHILGGVTSVDFSASGRYLFAGLDDYRVLVWDVQAGTMVQALNEHTNRVSCLGVGDDGNALCTGSWDAWLKIWA